MIDQQAPNMVVFICDDLGYGDLGCNGGSLIRTPNIDRLAGDGARFTAMYAGGPTCTPARSALLTGRLPPRTGTQSVLWPGMGGMHQDEKTLANYARSRGYATACVGKWHLGDMGSHGPMEFGFDRYFGLPFSNDMEPLAVYRDNTVVEDPADVGSLTARYTEYAVDFIREVGPSRPFLLYVAYNMPHFPVTPDPEFRNDSPAGPYGDVAEQIDWSVGEICACLSDLGIDDETIVVFTSDHGPWYEGSPGDVRGRKFDTWEGGSRVPFVWRWPGRIRAGTLITTPVSTMDFAATVTAELAARPVRPLDGRDISALIEGESSGGGDPQPIWYFDFGHVNAVRLGPWKYIRRRHSFLEPFVDRMSRDIDQQSLPQLFNLDIDRNESYDLITRRPDVAARLRALLERLDVDLEKGGGGAQLPNTDRWPP